MAPLLGLIVFLGVYPKPVLERIEPSVDALVAHVEEHSDDAAAGRGRGPDARRAAYERRRGRGRRRDEEEGD